VSKFQRHTRCKYVVPGAYPLIFKTRRWMGEWPVSLPGRLIPKQETSITPSYGRRSGTQSRFGHLKGMHISCPCRESSYDSFGVHAVSRSLTDCIIAAPVYSIMDEFCKPVILALCNCGIVSACVRACVCVCTRVCVDGTDAMVVSISPHGTFYTLLG